MSGTNPRVIRHNQPPGRGRVEMHIPVTSPNSRARNERTQKRRAHEQARRGRARGGRFGTAGRSAPPSAPTPTPRSVLPPRPSGHIHAAAGGSSRPSGTKPMGKAGKDYVHNLQQQIYFLEMETQFLRANAGEEVPTMSLSVDDQMSQLNRSFRDMEEKFRAEAEETAENLLQLQAKLTKRDKAYEQLKQYISEQQALAEAQKAKQAAELQRSIEEQVAANKKARTAEEDLAQVQSTLEVTEQSLAETKNTMRDESVRMNENLAEKNNELKKVRDDLKRSQEQCGEFEAEIKDLNATIETMRQEMNELKQSNADAIEARDKALTAQQLAEMNANQAEQAHLQRIADLESLTHKNRELETALFDAKQTIEKENARNDRLQQALTESNAERGTLRSRLNAADITVTQLQKRVQVQHTQRVDMSVELAAARGEVENAKEAQVAAEAKVAGIEDTNNRIESENTEIQARAERLAMEVETLNAAMDGNGETIRELESENASLRTQLDACRAKLVELKELDTLDVSKFTSLMQSNLQVAKTLEQFMKKTGQRGDEKSDE